MNTDLLDKAINLITKLKEDQATMTIEEVKELRRITPAISEHCADMAYEMSDSI